MGIIKKGYMRKLILIISFLWVVYSCKSTYTVTVYNLEPAPVELAKDIKRIGIIKEVGDKATSENIASLEALVEATDIELSKEGKEAALEGLLAELQKDKRFDTVMILSKTLSLMEEDSNGDKSIPWENLKELCLHNQLDAVFSLAFYQTDTRILERKSSMEELDMLRTRVVIPARELTLETLIENGWRIYDPFEQKVLDEIKVSEQVVTQAKGEDAVNALRSMTDRADSLMSKSRGSGSTFGLRLKPSSKAVERQIYIKGSPLLEQAEEAVKKEDWLEAARLWQMDLNHEKSAIRALACHNMAVLYEVKNDLNKAIEWAVQASTHDDGKAHSQYLETLKRSASQKLQAEKQWEAIALLRK